MKKKSRLFLAEALERRDLLTVMIGMDNFDSSLNLNSFSQVPATGFASGSNDAFQVLQRNSVPAFTIPPQLLDETANGNPADGVGIIGSTKTDKWFGVSDTWQGLLGGTNGGKGTATWAFNVAGYKNLSVSVDLAAMGDFENAAFLVVGDSMNWSYSFDNVNYSPVLSSSVNEAINKTYTMQGGQTRTLDDPMLVNGVQLSNVFQTFTANVSGIGNTLYLRVEVTNDDEGSGGTTEAIAFDNIRINGDVIPPVNADAGGPYSISEGGSLTLNANPVEFVLAGNEVGNNAILKNEFQLSASLLGLIGLNLNSAFSGTMKLDTDYAGDVLTGVKFNSGNLTLADASTNIDFLGIAGFSFSLLGVKGTVVSSSTESVTPDGNRGGTVSVANTSLILNDGTLTIGGTGLASGVAPLTINFLSNPATIPIGLFGSTATMTVDGNNIGTIEFELGGSLSSLLGSFGVGPDALAIINTIISGSFGIDLTGSANLTDKIFPPDLTYSWDVNNDGIFGDATGNRPTLTWSQLATLGVNDNGSRDLFVRVSNGINTATSPAGTLTISNTVPSISISGAFSIGEGSVYVLANTITDPGADTISQRIVNWGDGNTQTYTSPGDFTHVYADNGIYFITVSLVDEDGTYNNVALQTVTVDNVAPTAVIVAPTEAVRGEPITYVFSAVDPSSVDQASSFTYAIDWNGDGTTDEVQIAGSTLSFTRTYSSTGSNTVRAAVVDKNGEISSITTHTVTVSTYRTAPNPNNGSLTDLIVGGLATEDGILVVPGFLFNPSGPSDAIVFINFNDPNLGATYVPGVTGQVLVYMQGGDDLIVAVGTGSGPLSQTVVIHGGDGNDTVTTSDGGAPLVVYGGADNDLIVGIENGSAIFADGGDGSDFILGSDFADTLYGGDGDDGIVGGLFPTDAGDLIYGGAGRDVVLGGFGADTIFGGAGDDFLMTGGLGEEPPEGFNLEWWSPNDYATRTNNIQTGAGGLIVGPMVPGFHIIDDGAADEVYGEGDQDYFWMSLTQDTSPDRVLTEIQVAL